MRKDAITELLRGPYKVFRTSNSARHKGPLHIFRPSERKSFCGLTAIFVDDAFSITGTPVVCKKCGEGFEAHLQDRGIFQVRFDSMTPTASLSFKR